MPAPLRRALRELIRHHGCRSLKLSTEDAGNSFPQIARYLREFARLLPVEVKIGGPEARNDIRTLGALPVAALIVPMVESPYALTKFIETMRDALTPARYRQVRRRINLETETAVRQLAAILRAPAFREIDQATIGRSDLSRSYGLTPDHPVIFAVTRRLVRALQRRGLPVSIGGSMTPRQTRELIARVGPDYVNTRSLAFKVTRRFDPLRAIPAALAAEAEMLRFDAAEGFISRREAAARLATLESRARG